MFWIKGNSFFNIRIDKDTLLYSKDITKFNNFIKLAGKTSCFTMESDNVVEIIL